MDNNYNNIYNSLITTNEMLIHRGYKKQIPFYSKNEIKLLEKNNNLEFIIKENNKIIIIKYILFKLRPTYIKQILETLIENHKLNSSNCEIMLLLNENAGTSIEKIITKYITNRKFFIQLFLIKKLTINITKNKYVPQHRILSTDEVKEIYKTYNITNKSQIPIIFSNDPIAKYFAMRIGDICEIKRHSSTAGICYSYRICR